MFWATKAAAMILGCAHSKRLFEATTMVWSGLNWAAVFSELCN